MANLQPRLWLANEPLVLASRSSTRAELLADAGLIVESIVPDIDERALEAEAQGLNPPQLARHLAKAKAQDVARRHPGRVIIGADQVLELDGTVFHKPVDLTDAQAHLMRLQGRTHALHSAVSIAHGETNETFHDTARLTMRPLDTDAITAYTALAGETRVTSSVGGYQLEGLGIHLFDRIDGDHSTVLGLPLIPVLVQLRAMGLLAIG